MTRATALAGVLAMALQVALPIAHLPLAAADPSRVDSVLTLAAPASGTLCISDSGLGNRETPSRRRSHPSLPACALCQAVQHSGLSLPPNPASIAVPTSALATPAYAEKDFRPGRRIAKDVQPRAPPEPA